jgi:RHS repeat-associated protein
LYVEKIKTIATGAVVDKKYYLHRDYLGSIIAISNENGIAVERRHFDAWGNLAKLQQNGVLTPLPSGGSGGGMLLDRGYTSHEHLSEVGLIHIACPDFSGNGRLYDPVLRSFIMPDNFIQQPENAQNYNRYAYVLNNPLMYTDPSGEAYGNDVWTNPTPEQQQVGGGIIGSIVNFFKNPENGEWFRRNAGEIGRFVGRNFESAFKDSTGWIGKQAKSVGKFFSNLFKRSSRYEVSNVISLNYAAVNTTNTISNSFTAGSTVASGGFQSNYRSGSGTLSPAQEAIIKARNNAQRNFYGADIRIIPDFFGGGSYFAGAINIPKYMWDGYKNKGLDSYEGRFLMHEYGHYLQEEHNSLWYNIYTAPSSFLNAMFNNQTEHANHWAEIQASTYAYYYFGFPKKFTKENKINKDYLSLIKKIELYRRYLKKN